MDHIIGNTYTTTIGNAQIGLYITGRDTVLIDTGRGESTTMLAVLREHDLYPTAIINTHLHADHFSEAATREFLSRRQIRGLVLPASGQSDFLSFVKETGTPCSVLTAHTRKTVFRLSAEIQITAFRTLHLDRKYHDIPHFCYLIAFGEKKLLFTSDADYTEESFAFLGEETVTAAFVNPMFFSDLRRRRFFRGSLPAENIVVYHLPFPGRRTARP